ncbi:hypothetical protein RHGRI_026673 [Rhododendron griersonianum]|uniref:Uncharacterized protein n=1 Tax=Rhododendron griersonianum TaxID=479676 RepID=A0AAV6ITT2_9ERIC|nr:hypothetical protein RHGRI_028974 [Rhododendron griersonianum]KAG5530388.1 hypothetical protein RHGRI_025361 [Rhododendron griersonianum]KAG5532136.1 hypothetical protein RHGRI_026673 [Rhododendron griersonianum]
MEMEKGNQTEKEKGNIGTKGKGTVSFFYQRVNLSTHIMLNTSYHVLVILLPHAMSW